MSDTNETASIYGRSPNELDFQPIPLAEVLGATAWQCPATPGRDRN